jgi:putative membrane protein
MKAKTFAVATLLALLACGRNETATEDNSGVPAPDTLNAAENLAGGNAAVRAVVTGMDYVGQIAGSDMFEIASARLAQQKTQSADVKALADMLIADHQKSTAFLKTAASEAQPPITVVSALNPDQQASLNALRSLHGAAFDRIFAQQQIDAQNKTLTLLLAYAENGDIASLKRHAEAAGSSVKKGLERAQLLKDRLAANSELTPAAPV